MTGTKKFKRVVTCQGGIQLVAALAALQTREAEQQRSDIEYEDYLVIYDLYAPDSQLPQFTDAVQRMARALRDWKSIVYFSKEQMVEFDQQLTFATRSQVYQRIRDLVGVAEAGEVYLCRNWQFGNSLMLNIYRDAWKVCYGDSIGIYFSEAYFSPAVAKNGRPALKAVVRQQLSRIKHSLRSRLTGDETPLRDVVLDEIQFDVGYFLLPEILGETPPMQTRLVNKATTGEIFRKLARALDPEQIVAQYGYLAEVPAVILMTSNFSEASRMSSENELVAYREFLEKLELPRESTLIIKPHPRDGEEKVRELGRRLGDMFANVVLLMDQNLFFTPFEVFLIQTFLGEREKTPRNLNVITFSTACLSLPILFDIRPIIGFGNEIVRTSFFENYISGRLQHEHDLNSAMQTLSYG
ncbi:MAG TPA: polysialyltransferase family glycosyltransferase [Pyrinomonadaceae bacterium]|nr:polysialyltransferase family glycosyltransferase [Pyrinomonadaceae bacterium]